MKHEEELHQKAFFKWIGYSHPKLSNLCWHTPNGGKRSITEASRFKAMGVKPGVPDIFVAIPCGNYHGLFIEFKAGNNVLTPAQTKMMAELGFQNYMVKTCYSVDEAIETFEHYIKASTYV